MATYALALSFNVSGQFAVTVMHYDFLDSGFATSQQAANALLLAWGAAQTTNWQNILPTDTIFLSAKARRVSAVGGFEAVEPFVGGTTGARAGTVMASGISPVIVHYPVGNGKQRARTFLPGLSVNDCVNGVYTNAFVNDAATFRGVAFDNLTLVGGGAPVASFGIWKATTPVGFTASVFHELSDTVGTLRRRQQPA